jgi:hypothetical protein
MNVGQKAQGADVGTKICNPRHGGGNIRGKNAVEKAAETKVRQGGKKIIRNWKQEY